MTEVIYSGPMGCESFERLRSLVLDATAGAGCLVLRMDKVLDMMHCQPPMDGKAYKGNRVPAAVIVRNDQFDTWEIYARQIAKQGVMRAVFLDSFSDEAYRWARAHAGAGGRAALR